MLLLTLLSNRWTLIGITSAGFGCAVDKQPGIYHKVNTVSKSTAGVTFLALRCLSEMFSKSYTSTVFILNIVFNMKELFLHYVSTFFRFICYVKLVI